MMRLALAEWVKFVDISQLSVALHCNSLPRFIDTHIYLFILGMYKVLIILFDEPNFASLYFAKFWVSFLRI